MAELPSMLREVALARRTSTAQTKPSFRVVWQRHWMLYLMLLPSLVLLGLFHFYPMWGLSIAFVDYNRFQGVRGSEFVGLAVFRELFADPDFWRLLRNTVLIAVGKIVVGQAAALAFALMLHEVTSRRFRRVIQTATTLPHFLSWVIVGGIMVQMLSSTGIVTRSLSGIGLSPPRFLADDRIFPWTLVLSETWKEFGFGAIIYLAALTQINPELYESAAVDGAGRWARLWDITLPGIAAIVILLACLSLGNVLNAGFEQVLVLLNPVVYDTGDILDTWVYREGLLGSEYSLATAVGMFKGVIAFVLILLSYWLAGRFANYRVW